MITGPMARLPGKILIADDEESLLEIASARLAFVAEDVRVARDGAEAWRMIERDPPDVLVTDLMMPEMSGEELCVKVRESEQGKNLWILILTARRGTRQRVQGLDLGADDYLEKPFDLDELAARVRTGLRVRALQRELQSVARHEAIGWVAQALGHEIRNPLAVILANASVPRRRRRRSGLRPRDRGVFPPSWRRCGRSRRRTRASPAGRWPRFLRSSALPRGLRGR